MPLPRQKRTYDSMLWDFPCGPVLDTGEVITAIVGFSVLPTDCGLVCAAGQINAQPTGPYTDGSVGAIGQVGQSQISGGTIPAGADDLDLGVPNLLCSIKMKFFTSLVPNQIEVEVNLLLIDSLVHGG